YASQGRAETNALADKVAELFQRDEDLRVVYEEEIADGKWTQMMAQTHIGYTIWQQPEEQSMPQVIRIEVPQEAGFGVGTPGTSAVLPAVDVFAAMAGAGPASIEVFNTGGAPYAARVSTSVDWVTPLASEITVDATQEVGFEIDWAGAPMGTSMVDILVDAGDLGAATLQLPVHKPEGAVEASGFVAGSGLVSAEAAAASRIVSGHGVDWQVIPNLGRSGDGIATFPVTAPASEPGDDSPRLEFDVHLFEAGNVDVTVTTAPTLDFQGQGGIRFAVSIDDGAPVIVTAIDGEAAGDGNVPWEESVARNAHVVTTSLPVTEPGAHTVKIWRVDPGIVFQRVLVATGEVPETYLGPPDTPVCSPAPGTDLPECTLP
ncbi:MAG: hypothetical protein MRY64_10625, partial [Hyphomonadaceae bacterium]|nr:hypothetical protein [Hyphomonadaceae bacterium]